jgi:hypothetical protein
MGVQLCGRLVVQLGPPRTNKRGPTRAPACAAFVCRCGRRRVRARCARSSFVPGAFGPDERWKNVTPTGPLRRGTVNWGEVKLPSCRPEGSRRPLRPANPAARRPNRDNAHRSTLRSTTFQRPMACHPRARPHSKESRKPDRLSWMRKPLRPFWRTVMNSEADGTPASVESTISGATSAPASAARGRMWVRVVRSRRPVRIGTVRWVGGTRRRPWFCQRRAAVLGKCRNARRSRSSFASTINSRRVSATANRKVAR